ncbi:MAG: hypothetical protein KC620_08500, partial [Myxococcales bacterium]|nr:hypothetical protein [Myxococcales bacterium]
MRRILLALALLGCGTDEAPAPTPTLFDRPQALVFVGDALVVANTGYGADGWRPGALTVIDATTGALQNRIPTTGLNPQRLVVQGDRLYAVCTGALDFTDFDHPRAASPGGIDVVPLRALADAAGPGDHLALPLDPAAPIDLAFHGDRALVTSGLTDAVWPFETDPLAWKGDPAAPTRLGPAPRLALGAVAAWREGFAVVDFNTDRLYLLDAEGAPTGCAVEVGEVPGEVEGAQAPVVDGDDLYVLLVHAGRVRHVNLADLADDCAAPVDTVVDGLGLVPNDLHVRGDRLYVVHSGDNNVIAYDRDRGTEVARYVLQSGSNPWHAAFDAAGRRMAVTAWATHAVHVFDVQSTEPLAVFGATQTPAPAPARPLSRRGAAAFADTVIDAPGAHEGPFGDPARAANGARGAGDHAGGLDVYRLGLTGDEATLTLRWSDRRVVDGPGADLVG